MDPLGQTVLDPNDGLPGKPPVLAFHPRKLRVQVTITPEQCAHLDAPPADLFERAKTKMQTVKTAGEVVFFVLYRKRLEKTWAMLREAVRQGRHVPAAVTLTLAAGAPELPGLVVRPGSQPGALAELVIRAAPSVATPWRLDWVLLHVRKWLRDQGVRGAIDEAQVQGALARARAGLAATPTELKPRAPRVRPEGKPFELSVNQARREVYLTLFDATAVAYEGAIAARLARIEEALQRLREKRRGYRLLREELTQAFDQIRTGPEQLGIGLPLTILAAIDTSATDAPPRAAERDDGQPWLRFTLSDDRMTATIADGVAPPAGSRPVVATQLVAALRAAGIVHGVRSSLAEEIAQRLTEGAPLGGLPVAEGTPAASGREPYIHVVDSADARSGATAGSNLRVYQRNALVTSGQIVAEIRYAEPPVDGRDVTGRSIPPPAAESPPDPPLGEGIVKRGDGRFYAETSGLVRYDAATGLALEKVLVHEGDVNLVSGDIVFDGPVEIKGHVDSGARIRAGGDVIVHGEVRGGVIDCRGTLTVDQGIIAGASGRIRVRGDITCDFAENSTIICGGSLKAKRSVLLCDIVAGGEIAVTTAGGTLGGGTFVCASALRTGHLGLPDGRQTRLEVGVDFRAERSVKLRTLRLEALTKQSDDDRRIYQDLVKKPLTRLSRAEKSTKEAIGRRISRWGRTLETAQRLLDAALSRRKFDAEARIHVTGKLSTNCHIFLGGKPIPLTGEVTAVVVTTTELDGSHLRPMTAAS